MMREVLSLICCWGTNSDDGGPHLFNSLSQRCDEAAVLSMAEWSYIMPQSAVSGNISYLTLSLRLV